MHFLRKIFARSQDEPVPDDKNTDVISFYTDSEYAREVFEQLISQNLPKRLLVVHGLGGVGKSTLLKMYLLSCRKHHIPVALTASEEATSPVDVLTDWANDLSYNNVLLPTFQKTLNQYRAIQTKVDTEAKKIPHPAADLASSLGKTAAKTAISMAASAIPIVGPLVGTLGSESGEALIDWLYGFLSKPDMDLYFDPIKRLDNDFLVDLTSIAGRQRLVLMLDTYEQMTTQDEWLRELARQLPQNVLLVISGRTIPAWDRTWQGWMAQATIVELKEMTPDNLRTLVHRYYSHIHMGNPDPKQIEAIVQFARGMPIVATTVVQLWVKYGTEDFHTVRPQVVADLADRLLEGVPQEIQPAFEAAAVLRYFNIDALGALLEEGNMAALYTELRRWPFMRLRREGFAVHDTMREMINEALRTQTPERFQMLHTRAAAYYEALLEKSTSNERERSILEWLYHRVCINETIGMQIFQELAEDFSRSRMANRLRALLNDINSYQLVQENNLLWREYYNARLAHLEAKRNKAEEMYLVIGENTRAEPKLRAYALCDWGGLLFWRDRLRPPGMEEKVIHALELSLELGETVDIKLAMSWVYLSRVYVSKVDYQKGLFYLEQPKRFFTERNDHAGLLTILERERGIYWRQGNLRKTFVIEKEMFCMYKKAGEPSYMKTIIPPTWEWVWLGRPADHEHEYREAIQTAQLLQDQEYFSRRTRDLALILASQEKCTEAITCAENAIALAHTFNDSSKREVREALISAGFVCLKCDKLEQAEKYFTEMLSLAQTQGADFDIAAMYLAIVYEVQGNYQKAEHFYQLAQKEARLLDHNYTKCGILSGLVRVKYVENDYTAILPLWTEAETLAQQYEYHDYFASLYLTKGHLVWDGFIVEWENGFDFALQYYQYALTHALRYNRFSLDEVLSGRELGTPLQPIIRVCLKHGKEGRSMLLALRDWWLEGNNNSKVPGPNTISPIPEDVSLLEAERIARHREPGEGLHQVDVAEQLNTALAKIQAD